MEDRSQQRAWPFWDLIQGRWSTFLEQTDPRSGYGRRGKTHGSRVPCVACGLPMDGPALNLVMVRRTTKVGSFTQTEGLRFPFHPRCVESARIEAEREGLLWGDDREEGSSPQ